MCESGAVAKRENRAAIPAGHFEAIYDTYQGRVYGLAYRMMGNADDARDVTQDAFLSAYQNLHKLAPEALSDLRDNPHLAAWLYRIASNKCIDALRKRKRRASVDWDTFAQTARARPDDGGQPEAQALKRERAELVQRVLDTMTPRYRLVLLLHEHQGMSVREIADTVGRSESAVKSMLFRARDQFRSLYELEGAIARAA
jgi:RNA polymerase sigma-70 factor (ECF subfamily)